MDKSFEFGSYVVITSSPENDNEFVSRWGVIVQEMPMLNGDTEQSYLVAVENSNFGGSLLLCTRKASELI